uniref:Mesothelin n=1 Tax=Strigops habroptila TaxID=2489341 RepID=A0A672UBG7_STRHB
MVRLSQSVLQGFTCAAANEVEEERFQELAKVMKKKNVKLGEDQLFGTIHYNSWCICLSSPSDYAATGSCRQYFANIGKANLDLLQRESSQRKQLLLEALACLVRGQGTSLGRTGDAEALGRLVCDLGGEYITSSGGNLLKQLSQCDSFLPDQEEAIRSIISSGNTTFGPPAAWSAFTLDELSGLIPVFDHSILQQIPKVAHLMIASTGCPSGKQITESVLENDLMPVIYSPVELRACLKNVSLENHLSQLLTYAFTVQHLAVLKEHLDETYPDGYPESLLFKLGSLVSFITPEDVSKWNIASADTLAALLRNEPPDDQVGSWVCFTAYVCFLVWELVLASLNLSACSERTKEILYAKAKSAFSDQRRSPAYYELIEPYLGGAPAADLKALSKDNVNMNISTFMKLRRDSLMSLTPLEVEGLLGMHLGDLSKWQKTSPIREWVQKQKQSELDKLHVGLTGGTQEGYINIVTPKFQSLLGQPCLGGEGVLSASRQQLRGQGSLFRYFCLSNHLEKQYCV